VLISGANDTDAHLLLPLLDTTLPIQSPRGRPRRKPGKLHADKAYDNQYLHAALRADRIKDRIARKNIESSQRLGRHRWVIERTMCAASRSVVSPAKPGGTRREVLGSNDLPVAER
jgi:hypothetical protein